MISLICILPFHFMDIKSDEFHAVQEPTIAYVRNHDFIRNRLLGFGKHLTLLSWLVRYYHIVVSASPLFNYLFPLI